MLCEIYDSRCAFLLFLGLSSFFSVCFFAYVVEHLLAAFVGGGVFYGEDDVFVVKRFRPK